MCKLVLSSVLVIAFCFSLFGQGGVLVPVPYDKSYEVNGKVFPVELVYTPNDGYIKLRIRFDSKKWDDEKAVEFLKKEVLRLAWGGQSKPPTSPVVTTIGNYTFIFTSGYPTWIPRRNLDYCFCQNLTFAKDAKVVGQMIVAEGTARPIYEKYYPYLP